MSASFKIKIETDFRFESQALDVWYWSFKHRLSSLTL